MSAWTPLQREALAYLASHQVMTLATTGADGVWAAAVFYVNEGFDLFFLSAAGTRHAAHLSQNPRVAATIQEDYQEWAEIMGIQCAGKVSLLQGQARKDAVGLYRRKFPFLNQAPQQIRAALARVGWYRLRPDLFYLIDNSKGFGHRDQIATAA